MFNQPKPINRFVDGLGREWAYLPERVQVWSPHNGVGRNKNKKHNSRYLDLGRVRVLAQFGYGETRFDSLSVAQAECTKRLLRGAAFSDTDFVPYPWRVPAEVKSVTTWPGMTIRVQAEEWPYGLERLYQPTVSQGGKHYWSYGVTGAIWLLAHCGFHEERHPTLESALSALRAR